MEENEEKQTEPSRMGENEEKQTEPSRAEVIVFETQEDMIVYLNALQKRVAAIEKWFGIFTKGV
jgi:hypothetical protein